MGECACRRTGRQVRLQELPCGEHMIIIRGADGGWTPAPDDGVGRFAVHATEASVELEDRNTGERRDFPDVVEALVTVCRLCDDPDAPCRNRCTDRGGVTPDSA